MNFPPTGQIIRDAREKSDLTQAELARRLGMSRATISRLENGTIEELGVRKLARLCDRLGLEIGVRPRQAPTVHEAYGQNRRERRAVFRETDEVLKNLQVDTRRQRVARS